MADVTNPQAIAFVDQVVRPLASRSELWKIKQDEAATDWFSGINTLIPNDADSAILDGREAEGISRLTGADIHSFMAVVIAMGGQYNSQVVTKPTPIPIQIP